MLDYRNHLKRILQQTSGDDQSLQNSLNAIKAIIAMADDGESSESIAKSSPKKVESHTQENQKDVRQLLNGLTSLITSPGDPNAKKRSLNALHKLTFIPGIGKIYGHEIGKLDQAIQASVTTQAAVNARTFKAAVAPKKKPKRDYRKGKRYVVIRLISGADLVNDGGQTVYTLKESQVHPLNLKSGDIVEAVKSDNPNYEADIIRVVGYQKLRNRDYDKIEDFKYAVVQGRAGQLSISRNIHGQKLRVRGKNVVLPVDSSYYQGNDVHLEDGSIVDLAWYTGDVRLKKDPAAAIQIRWIYQVDEPQEKRPAKKERRHQTKKETDLTRLDMDLHYQRVGIAIGDNQNEGILESIVTRYHGIPIPINAFEGKKKVIENQIKNVNIVILETAYAAHDSTWNIREFASKYGAKFAVSSSKGYQSFERALYRAENGLPAYEGNQTIDYKTIAD